MLVKSSFFFFFQYRSGLIFSVCRKSLFVSNHLIHNDNDDCLNICAFCFNIQRRNSCGRSKPVHFNRGGGLSPFVVSDYPHCPPRRCSGRQKYVYTRTRFFDQKRKIIIDLHNRKKKKKVIG